MGSQGGTDVAEEHGIRRSPKWPSVEKHVLASNPRCLACSDDQHAARLKQVAQVTRGLQVHHAVMPFHFCILLGRPELELDPRNLIVLCENEPGVITEDHHNVLGHLRDFRSYAPDARAIAKEYFGKSRFDIVHDFAFVSMCYDRPKEWGRLTAQEKADLRAVLDQKLPRL